MFAFQKRSPARIACCSDLYERWHRDCSGAEHDRKKRCAGPHENSEWVKTRPLFSVTRSDEPKLYRLSTVHEKCMPASALPRVAEAREKHVLAFSDHFVVVHTANFICPRS